MSTPLIIVARIQANKEHEDLVKSQLLQLIDITRNQEGCVQYDLHQDNNKPEIFVFYEIWESRELWQAHMDSPPLQKFMAATQEAVADFVLHEMTRIA
ncbi:putative quinol monooxygenase [Desulfoplanes formicivorans]|uniref:Antibiotic biosynthesis monooxygenase n=1 Tax=Desulfoplanes formicivorans TaxID=1592317 RepID=A0A194ABW5_9BACT|nr:putative quinol monooxygenase [Desulfoplanes formicivorans]GAU07642.1 antibiotic biosynthesis monooxygenase [Desulfoplanes formicivorans]